jgi:hypothetical protein
MNFTRDHMNFTNQMKLTNQMKRANAVLPLAILVMTLASNSPAQSADTASKDTTGDPTSVRIPEPPECPPYPVKPGTPVSTPEQTRAAAMAYFDAGHRQNVEAMDKTMVPDAHLWYAGFGCADRSKFVAGHYDPKRPKSTFVRVQFKSLLVEGDKAVLEMVTEQAWPGGGYLKFHSIHLWVSQGKIVSLRQYSVDAKPPTATSPMGRMPTDK